MHISATGLQSDRTKKNALSLCRQIADVVNPIQQFHEREVNMHEAFFKYLNRFDCPPLSEQEKMLFRQAFIPAKLKKRQCLLQTGEQ